MARSTRSRGTGGKDPNQLHINWTGNTRPPPPAVPPPEVPDDWDGEPLNIGVPLEAWNDAQHAGVADFMLEGLKEAIRNGDSVYLQDYDEKPTYRFILNGDEIELRKLGAD